MTAQTTARAAVMCGTSVRNAVPVRGGLRLRFGGVRAAAWALLWFAVMVATPASAAASGIDGPGSYYMFRSFDTGVPFTAEQQAACNEHYGVVRGETAIDLNAELFAFGTDLASGRVIDQKAAHLGPAFVCLAPTASLDLLEMAAFSPPPFGPVAGLSRAAGPCPVAPALAQPGALVGSCKLAVPPDPGIGSLGGVATSNSVLNPTNRVPGSDAPTGSIWTAYIVPGQGTTLPPPLGGEPKDTPDPSPGLEFYAVRTSAPPLADAPSCPQPPLLTRIVGRRSSTLAAAEPDPVEGKLPAMYGPRSGAITICFTGTDPAKRTALARLELERGGQTIQLTAGGDCRDLVWTPGGPQLRQQTCSLSVQSSSDPNIAAGLVTSNGLVTSDGVTATNSHVWTVALFTDTPLPSLP